MIKKSCRVDDYSNGFVYLSVSCGIFLFDFVCKTLKPFAILQIGPPGPGKRLYHQCRNKQHL